MSFFFLCTLFFCGESWATKHTASHFSLWFEDLFLSICKAVETVYLFVSTRLDRRPVSWIRQFTPGYSQRSSTLCAGELNRDWRRWEWQYKKQMMPKGFWTCPHVSTCPVTCCHTPKGKLRLFCEAASLAVPMPRLVVIPKTKHLTPKIKILDSHYSLCKVR